ncbi:MAG: diaminopimelate decarboxylase [Actinomycetia bacterium]|nr:diaminopimelate decarboxylase [Actinomycetes bacterium]
MADLAHDPNARADGRHTLELGGVLPSHIGINAAGHLSLANVDLVDLAKLHGTALYVMDEAQIRCQLLAYESALASRWPDFEVAYAGKAFLCKAMCKLVAEEGGWLDVSSGGELACALAAGFDPSQIIAHGNNKTEHELGEAITAGIGRIACDSFEEIERIERLAAAAQRIQQVYLRVKPGVVADTHSHIQTGKQDSKFGFGLSDGWAAAAVEQAMNAGHIELAGLHFHIGSQIFAFDSYEKAIEALFDFIAHTWATYRWLPAEIDLGGGIGVAYQATDRPESIEQFAETICSALERQCQRLGIDAAKIKLVVEPGRSIVANAGVTLYTVGAIKRLEGIRNYLAVDGGMADNIRPALYNAHYECAVADRAAEPRSELVTVVGKHCESGDVLIIDASIQPPKVGDTLAVFATGAYNQSMASNYNKQPRPAVLWLRDGEVRQVVRRETYDDLLTCDMG